jgi:RNA polymerase-binding transcription factor DksA
MKHHFHRCGHLRVLEVDASEISHERKGGSQILEELCEAKRLARCVGLAECDVLPLAQKRELLTTRARRLRDEEAGGSPLADAPDARAAELRELRSDFEDEYRRIVEENRARKVEAAGAVERNPRPLPPQQDWSLAVAGISVFLDDELRELRTARLDALERALAAIERGRFGTCARCKGVIDVERLRETPDTAVCDACEREVWPDRDRPAWAEPQPSARSAEESPTLRRSEGES